MSASGVQRQQQIVRNFYQRRARELATLIPIGLAVYGAWGAYHDPAFTVWGLGGWPLLGLAVAVLAACFAHHWINWRCPACGWRLNGFLILGCERCGAILVKLRKRPTQPELEARRRKYQLQALAAVLLAGLGLFLMMFLANQPGAVRPDGWLSRLSGGEPRLALQVTGFGIIVLGFLWMFVIGFKANLVDRRLKWMSKTVRE
jgi:hypothetical protein